MSCSLAWLTVFGELVKVSPFLNQLAVGALLDNFATLQHHYPITIYDCRKAMSYYKLSYMACILNCLLYYLMLT